RTPGLWRQGAPRLSPGAGDHAVADHLGVDDLLAAAVAYPHDVSLAPVGQGLPQGAGLHAILAGDDGYRLAPAHPQGGVEQVGGERLAGANAPLGGLADHLLDPAEVAAIVAGQLLALQLHVIRADCLVAIEDVPCHYPQHADPGLDSGIL